jgi:hypothetical protein
MVNHGCDGCHRDCTPGLSRPSTPCLLTLGKKDVMPATSAGMTAQE